MLLRWSGTVSEQDWAALILSFAYSCGYCGAWGTALTMDHRVPISRGGTHTIENIIPSCRACNSRKGTKTEEEFRRLLVAEGRPAFPVPATKIREDEEFYVA